MQKGDKVNYTVFKKKGRGFSISSKEGDFDSYIIDGNVKIKTKNGLFKIMSKDLVTPVGERNALTKALVGDK